MAELNTLKIWACYYYHQMGFNITHIVPTILEYSTHPFSLEQTLHLFKKNITSHQRIREIILM